MASILIADDDAVTRMMLRELLELDGHKVAEAKDGKDCLLRLESSTPDILIIDVFMPQMNGIDTVIEIRNTNPTLKIIGVSSGGLHGQTPYLNAIRTCGANQVLSKPINSSLLLLTVKDLLASA